VRCAARQYVPHDISICDTQRPFEGVGGVRKHTSVMVCVVHTHHSDIGEGKAFPTQA
jgi:hypothetical protein